MRIGILVPHVFAQEDLLDKVIFAPVHLAVDLADGLSVEDEVTLFTPGSISTVAQNVTVDMTNLDLELEKEGCTLPELITKNPLSFVSLSRQVQAELSAKAFSMSKSGKFDILHVFICESEIPLYFADLVDVPIVFTHHDPYNFYRGYRARFPSLSNLNYVSITMSQRRTAPEDLNFVGNVYNGVDLGDYTYTDKPDTFFAFFGRIVQNKGCHTAIRVCRDTESELRIAGKYYSGGGNDNDYWFKHVNPYIDGKRIKYEGFLTEMKEKSAFLGHAKALLFPIEWDEPFGMVMIESMACGTPVIAFDRGSVSEIVEDGVTGFIVHDEDEMKTAMKNVDQLNRESVRNAVAKKFSVDTMVLGYRDIYSKLVEKR
jgi:glycosyltransferase involved in cell wall biosynthesis